MKILGACALLLLGLAMAAFAGMAYSELRTAARSPTAPTPDSMPLTKVIGPELFDPGKADVKPATLARTVFNRILVVGGLAMLLLVAGLIFLVLEKPSKNASVKSD